MKDSAKNKLSIPEALSTLLEHVNYLTEASKRLGLEWETLTWDGFAVSEWESDFKKRLEIVNWEARKAQLDETKKKLKSLVSEEARTGMEIEAIEKLLGRFS